MAREANCSERRWSFLRAIKSIRLVLHHVEARHNSVIFSAVADENRRERLEQLDDLINILVRSDGGERRLEKSSNGQLPHLRGLHSFLKQSGLAQRADEIPLIEYRELG